MITVDIYNIIKKYNKKSINTTKVLIANMFQHYLMLTNNFLSKQKFVIVQRYSNIRCSEIAADVRVDIKTVKNTVTRYCT
jgi:hypothetical protein